MNHHLDTIKFLLDKPRRSPEDPPDLNVLFELGKRALTDSAQRTTRERRYLPNRVTFTVSRADHARLINWEPILQVDLQAHVDTLIASKVKYVLPGGQLTVRLLIDHTLPPGSPVLVDTDLVGPATATTVNADRPNDPVGPVQGRLHRIGGGAAPLTLVGDQLVLGRDTSCDLVIDDGSVSRRHAELTFSDTLGWLVRDLDSLNGTWINEETVGDVPSFIADGEVLTVGDVELRLDTTNRPDRPTRKAVSAG